MEETLRNWKSIEKQAEVTVWEIFVITPVIKEAVKTQTVTVKIYASAVSPRVYTSWNGFKITTLYARKRHREREREKRAQKHLSVFGVILAKKRALSEKQQFARILHSSLCMLKTTIHPGFYLRCPLCWSWLVVATQYCRKCGKFIIEQEEEEEDEQHQPAESEEDS
jgi:hypothetical protein